ncbi:MAG: hypothetical protein ACRD8Z_17830 [Nitrososphaeraceae archaeon]
MAINTDESIIIAAAAAAAAAALVMMRDLKADRTNCLANQHTTIAEMIV